MTMPLRLIVHGASGRMGREVVRAASSSPDVDVVAALARSGSDTIGADAGILAGISALGVPVSADVDAALQLGEVAVDVSVPGAAVHFAKAAAAVGKPIVVATTGFSGEQRTELERCSESAPVLVAPNLSLGINLLVQILPTIVRALGSDYDIEVVEAHHRQKKDAPSGTAVRLAEVIAEALERPLAEIERHGRHGLAPRAPGEMGIHAIRAGGIVGEHHVLFVSEGEQVEVTHRAFSRQTFALGAVRAAQFIASQPPGLYSMQDVLG